MKLGDQIFIAPTDTIYGVLCSAFSRKGVEKVFKVKGRDDGKPLIVLISKISDLEKFGINLTEKQKTFLTKHWPNKLTVIIDCNNKKYSYIHRNLNCIGFRLPKNKKILDLIKRYGPLVAPSANRQGEKTVETIREAKKLFGNSIDFYIGNGKRLIGKSSTLIKLDSDANFEILRQGELKL